MFFPLLKVIDDESLLNGWYTKQYDCNCNVLLMLASLNSGKFLVIPVVEGVEGVGRISMSLLPMLR